MAGAGSQPPGSGSSGSGDSAQRPSYHSLMSEELVKGLSRIDRFYTGIIVLLASGAGILGGQVTMLGGRICCGLSRG